MSSHDSKPRIAYLTAGGAGMFCGSCMRDNTLAAALARLDCDPWLIPLYTPIRTDEANVSVDTVFFGGINVYLQDRFALFRHLPAFLDRWLDAPWLLRRATQKSIDVDARVLGSLTVSMLRGERGRQRKEVLRLVRWLKDSVKPSLVNFSNLMIAGCAPVLRRELGVPLLATLQGDDLFLEDLVEPYKTEAMTEIRKLAQQVDGFITFSDYYADFMADYLRVPRDRFRLAPMGIAEADLPADAHPVDPARPFTVGYFARICPAKGFHLAVEAWLRLRTRPGAERARFHAAGWLGETDRRFFEREVERIRAAGAEADFFHGGVLERKEKFEFLQSVDVLTVPTTYREPKGIFALEALACGVPVVLPEHGAFPELLAETGGGELFPPHDVGALADALYALMRDADRRRGLGEEGRRAVRSRFTADAMARATLDIFHSYMHSDRRTAAGGEAPESPRSAKSPAGLS